MPPRTSRRTYGERLGSVPARVWVVAYIIAVFAFAGIYNQTRNDFYHSTARYEPRFYQDATQIESDISHSFRDYSALVNGGKALRTKTAIVDTSTIDVFALDGTDSGVTMELGVEVKPLNPSRQEYIQLYKLNILISHTIAGVVGLTDFGVATLANVEYESDKAALSEDGLSVDMLIPDVSGRIYEGATPPPTTPVAADPLHSQIPMHLDDYNRVSEFYSAYSGFPSRSNGEYWRMLYFSTTTITTLGYGDIVPLTDRARFLTAAESSIGIVLIGLFLNSLTHVDKREPRPDAGRPRDV